MDLPVRRQSDLSTAVIEDEIVNLEKDFAVDLGSVAVV